MNLLPEDGNATLQENYYLDNEAKVIFKNLLKKIEYKTETISMFGKNITVPRLIAWYGDKGISYKYSKKTHIAEGWPSFLLPIKERLEKDLKQEFNFVLCNLYRNGEDYMGWHDDGEKEMGDNPVIASLSFGITRKFDFRHKSKLLKISIDLSSGSLLTMIGRDTQRLWQHRLTKCKNVTGERINLTFRKIY